MTGSIYTEWLRCFNERMRNRRVLLIDSFSAHQAGIDLTEDLGYALTNVRVEFLPTNATSVCQPLDQGIIRTWKAYYRQRWLRFAIARFQEDKDPDKAMNVLQAIRWGIAAWNQDVTSITITNCWLKSRVLGPSYGPITRDAAIQDG
jgi:DDE superfamily endonuclease